MIVDIQGKTDPWETVLAHGYKQLFNAVTDALEQLEQENFGLAKDLLIRGQNVAEEILTEVDNPLEAYDPVCVVH